MGISLTYSRDLPFPLEQPVHRSEDPCPSSSFLSLCKALFSKFCPHLLSFTWGQCGAGGCPSCSYGTTSWYDQWYFLQREHSNKKAQRHFQHKKEGAGHVCESMCVCTCLWRCVWRGVYRDASLWLEHAWSLQAMSSMERQRGTLLGNCFPDSLSFKLDMSR